MQLPPGWIGGLLVEFADCFDAASLRERYRQVVSGKYQDEAKKRKLEDVERKKAEEIRAQKAQQRQQEARQSRPNPPPVQQAPQPNQYSGGNNQQQRGGGGYGGSSSGGAGNGLMHFFIRIKRHSWGPKSSFCLFLKKLCRLTKTWRAPYIERE